MAVVVGRVKLIIHPFRHLTGISAEYVSIEMLLSIRRIGIRKYTNKLDAL